MRFLLMLPCVLLGYLSNAYSDVHYYMYAESENVFKLGMGNPNSSEFVNVIYQRNIEGWSDLVINANPVKDTKEYLLNMRTYGFAEGYVTCKELQQSYLNFYADSFGEALPGDDLLNFIIENYLWMETEGEKGIMQGNNFWLAAKASLQQLIGIGQGYSASPCAIKDARLPLSYPAHIAVYDVESLNSLKEHLGSVDKFSFLHILMMQAWGDLYTIQTKMFIDSLNITSGFREKRISYPGTSVERDLRCSSLFKMLPNFEDIIFGHTTWCGYTALGPRTFKHYNLPSMTFGQSADIVTSEMRVDHFSSAAGLLASLDDFYIITSPTAQLAVIETTHDNYNPKLFGLVKPQSVLCWMRVVVANSVATNGKSWAELFSTFPSGTYTNQWQVLDITRFTPGEKPTAGLFTLLEEIPGEVVFEDMTERFLSDSYWASYNIPFFDQISKDSYNAKACEIGQTRIQSNESCWGSCARANIFRQKQGAVTGIEDFKRLMQYNDWQHDPLSLNDPGNAISKRRDLDPKAQNRYPSGGTDSKVSSAVRVLRSPSYPLMDIKMGPTSDQQPVFCWSTFEEEMGVKYAHFGQPDCFDYKWAQLPPTPTDADAVTTVAGAVAAVA